jgi:hypothetical protein
MLADEIQRQTSRRGRIEDSSLGFSGSTSVAAPATVARFVADGESTATITKPIKSRGEERRGEGIEPRSLHSDRTIQPPPA